MAHCQYFKKEEREKQLKKLRKELSSITMVGRRDDNGNHIESSMNKFKHELSQIIHKFNWNQTVSWAQIKGSSPVFKSLQCIYHLKNPFESNSNQTPSWAKTKGRRSKVWRYTCERLGSISQIVKLLSFILSRGCYHSHFTWKEKQSTKQSSNMGSPQIICWEKFCLTFSNKYIMDQ